MSLFVNPSPVSESIQALAGAWLISVESILSEKGGLGGKEKGIVDGVPPLFSFVVPSFVPNTCSPATFTV